MTWEKKIKASPGYVCKDRADLYRPANETEIALGAGWQVEQWGCIKALY